MSLLGKLFSATTSTGQTTPRSSNLLDSNLEDHFTYNLLFPDADALCHKDQLFPFSSGTALAPANANTFDINGEIDLDMRDVRVIIMQEATSTTGTPYVLYDSHTPPLASPFPERQNSNNSAFPTRSENRRSMPPPRKTSVGQNSRPVVIQQESTTPRAFGAFDRRSAHKSQASYTETEGQRSLREYKEEVTTISNCIFGNSEVLAYKGTGTKVHILPSDSRSFVGPSSYAGDGSFGRSSMRSSKLAQSFTVENGAGPAPAPAGPSTATSTRGQDRKKVLITRMFPVPLPNEEVEPQTPVLKEDKDGYPFPKVADNDTPLKKPQPKQKRTPMYAVGLIVHLPASPPRAPSAPTSRSSFRASSSYNEQDSFPSSFSSTKRAGWTMLGSGFGIESLESSIYSDVDDRIDMITQHWDIITRTLTHLQAVATESLLCLLRQADISSPGPRRESNSRAPSASISVAGRRVTEDAKPFKVPKTNAKLVQLGQDCLVPIQKIHKEVDASRQRVISGIKGLQVITGQGRWGIWREEARLAERWAGGKDKGFFFFNLLTGFLGNHTEWLQALGPSWYRRRHYQTQRSYRDDDVSVPARTIIVSDDKMAARRLIFLLSAFLPASQQLGSRAHRPSTSISLGGYPQSPPSYIIPALREESLRRKINKRSGASRASHPRAMSFPAQSAQASQISQPSKPQTEHPSGLGIIVHDVQRDRSTSDISQIRTANLPIPGSDRGTRKSSAATTRTATPITTVPHFSTRAPVRGTGPIPRPGSSGSLAADDLLRSLKRGDSSGQYSNVSTDSQNQNSRWGSMLSGFWSSKRRPSTTNTSATSMEEVEINDPYYRDITSQPRVKLPSTSENAAEVSPTKSKVQQERDLRKSESGSTETARAIEQKPGKGADEITEQAIQISERIPDPSGAYESPVKTSIADDGAIEIDVPLPDYLAFETAVSSPSSSGYLSTPGLGNGLEGFEHYSRAGPDSDTTINVGGYLPRYHPDFALQALPSQSDLISDIKESMRAEPTPVITSTPNAEDGRADRWVDVSSALVADTTNFTITHIRYRRHVKLKGNADPTTPAISTSLESKYGNVYSAVLLTPSLEVYDDHEDQFIEEQLVSMDETLIEAVERIIAQSGQASKQSSACSSRSTSRRPVVGRDRSNSDTRVVPGFGANLEVPRNECKKMVLSALEEIVKEVAESREDGDGEQRLEGREKESFLREGVRNWLGTVESVE
ncbi:6ec28dac-c7e7-4fca-a115-368e47609744-CDS [Sclerotinia trifoliorum]|uniref:6ec28dac-c7e7-4fca-a115-368e47609744-CDS n=1 Tax=Sclerotinia trifoliorum TaxID=28548 RepID=A0A8H2W3D2_9HELO|nr:6ec28dac-c7e7-4fca-a115-368e47609744-CDS [Sclerotinia trifoliorum]